MWLVLRGIPTPENRSESGQVALSFTHEFWIHALRWWLKRLNAGMCFAGFPRTPKSNEMIDRRVRPHGRDILLSAIRMLGAVRLKSARSSFPQPQYVCSYVELVVVYNLEVQRFRHRVISRPEQCHLRKSVVRGVYDIERDWFHLVHLGSFAHIQAQ